MNCVHCEKPVPEAGRRDRIYCTEQCRMKAFNIRRRTGNPAPPSWQHPALRSDTSLLRAAAVRARDLSHAHGWDRHTRLWVLDGLTDLLNCRPLNHRVPLTDVLAIENERVPRTRVIEVLKDMDLLDDDLEPSVDRWIRRSANAFRSGFSEPIMQWLTGLYHGGKRERPRSRDLVYRYFGSVRPFIARWSQQYSNLREVDRDDIRLALEPLQGFQHTNAIVALRSLFRFAKRKNIVFVNPTTYFQSSKPAFNPQPMNAQEIRAIEQAAQTSPAIKLVVALAAEHGARLSAIRMLTFDDIDLPNRRIVIAGHPQRLGSLSHQSLSEWLQYRRVKWPKSPNQHVLITGRSAPENRPVSKGYFRKGLWPRGFRTDPIREDRIMHEAITASPDPLHLSMIFGLTHATATRYAAAAQAILEDNQADMECESGKWRV